MGKLWPSSSFLRLYDALVLHCRLHRLCSLGLHVKNRVLDSEYICYRLASRYIVPNVLWFHLDVQAWCLDILLGRKQLRWFPLHYTKYRKRRPPDLIWPLPTACEDPHVHHCRPSHCEDILFLEDFPHTDTNRSYAYKCHLGPQDLPLILHNFDPAVFLALCSSWSWKCSIENRFGNTIRKRHLRGKFGWRL